MENSSNKKIGIFVESEKISGGVFQELSLFIKNLEKYNKNFNLKFKIICASKKLGFDEKLTNFQVKYFKLNFIQRYFLYLINYNNFFRRFRKFINFKNKFEIFLKRSNIDFVIFTGASQYSLYLEKTNFCLWIHDVDHRDYLEYPEVGNLPLFLWKDNISL